MARKFASAGGSAFLFSLLFEAYVYLNTHNARDSISSVGFVVLFICPILYTYGILCSFFIENVLKKFWQFPIWVSYFFYGFLGTFYFLVYALIEWHQQGWVIWGDIGYYLLEACVLSLLFCLCHTMIPAKQWTKWIALGAPVLLLVVTLLQYAIFV